MHLIREGEELMTQWAERKEKEELLTATGEGLKTRIRAVNERRQGYEKLVRATKID